MKNINGIIDNDFVNEDTFSWLQSIYKNPLTNLGKNGDQTLEGIYSPIFDQEEIDRFMSKMYSSDEGAKNSDEDLIGINDYYQRKILNALEIIDYETKRPLTILELGCGSGSATIPILRIFPKARVIASELSVSMLKLLNQRLKKENYQRNYAIMQLNAEKLDFHPGTFDIIIGSAILHHLFSPEETIGKCWDLLKPGGIAIFFEPFESGYNILSLIYRELLKENRTIKKNRLTRTEINYLQNCIHTWGKMRNQDKTDSFFFTEVDDKWAFTKPYFERTAQKYGFNKLIIYPITKSSFPFKDLVKVHSSGNNINLPQLVWTIVDQYEENFNLDLKIDLLTEGTVIFIK